MKINESKSGMLEKRKEKSNVAKILFWQFTEHKGWSANVLAV